MPIFQKNLNRVCPILENPMQLNKDILNTNLLSKEKRNTDIQNTLSLPFLSVLLTTLPLTGKQYHSRKGSEWIKSHQRKNKFRSKHRKGVPFP